MSQGVIYSMLIYFIRLEVFLPVLWIAARILAVGSLSRSVSISITLHFLKCPRIVAAILRCHGLSTTIRIDLKEDFCSDSIIRIEAFRIILGVGFKNSSVCESGYTSASSLGIKPKMRL